MNKRSRIHKAIFILIVGGAALTIVGLLLLRSKHTVTTSASAISDNQIYNKTLMAGNLSIPVSVADTEAARDQGLSGTASLPANAGKLFVFQSSGTPGFWMKDMNYDLDFVWLDSTMKIIAITPNVAASTYPEIFYPPQPVLYVLEVNAGFSTAHHLVVGEQFIFS